MAAATALCALALAPAAGAADWLPAFDLGGTGVRDAGMTPSGDIVFVINTAGGPALRFRPAGGPLGPVEQPFPAGASAVRADVDSQGNAVLVWTRAGTAELRVRRRNGTLTDVQTLQAGVAEGTPELAVSGDGHAAVAWIASDAGRAGAARTRAPDGTLGPVQAVTVAAEKTRSIDLDIDAAGNATFAWTTPDAPPNTKIKARRLTFATQTLSAVLDVSIPVSPELSDTERVVVDPAGNATLVWRHSTATLSLVETRQLSAAGALGTTQVVSTTGFSAQSHDVAVDDAGRARITWAEHSGTDPFQPVTCFSAVGSSCGAKLTLGPGPSLSTSIAVGPAGDALVGFAASGTAPGQVRVLPRPGGGPALAARTLGPAAQLPLLGADTEGNGVAVWDEGGAARAEGFDNAPPVVQALSIPAVIERTDPVAATATVRDVWGAAVAWSFGDGGSADGAAVQHAFARTGTFEVRATATDGTGATASATAAVTVRDTRAPALGKVTMRRTRFRAARAATPVSAAAAARRRPVPRGSDLRFSLGEDAAVTIAVQRRTIGRRAGRACRRARGAVPRSRRCVRFVSAGRTLRRALGAGRRRVAFTGRIGRRALAAGRYRVRVQATDAARNRSGVRTTAFTILR
ncbi:MAG: PKD domain-containing protein [Solirubrobacteraceae bacterium]